MKYIRYLILPEPMPISDTCIYFIISILGLAYPISLPAITRLDDKYKSILIVQRFRKSWEFLFFQGMLITAIIAIAVQMVWIINWKPVPPEKMLFWYHDWAEILLAIITALLIVAFFFFTRRIIQFYIPSSLVSWLRKKKDDQDFSIFKALTRLLFFGIQIRDEQLVATLRAHFSQLFQEVRRNAGSKPAQYPVAYYEMIYDTIYNSNKTDYWKVGNVGFTAASGGWLIGRHEYTHIDDLTYAWLWNNLLLMLRVDREDFVEEFWQNSHELIRFGLEPVPWQHDPANLLTISNQAEIDQRELEREKFFEFHTALGAMLLYEKRYRLLKRLLNHTTSIPVQYELLPMTMGMVLNLFFRFWRNDGLFYFNRFQFPGQDGIQGEFLSREYMAKYTALLFIRQYFLVSQTYGIDPVSMPQGPNTQEERTTWIRQLPYFKKLVKEIQQETELLKALDYEPIPDAWAPHHDKTKPSAILDELLNNIQVAYNATEVEQQAEEEKKTQFKATSSQTIDARIYSYSNVQNARPITDKYESDKLRGGYILYQKAAFAADQGVTYLNYDSFFAADIASNFTWRITELFRSKVLKSLLFRAPEFFQAIDKMRLNAEQHIFLNFGVSIEIINLRYRIDQLQKDNYKGIQIITVEFVNYSVMESGFIVMHKADLPSFDFSAPPAEEIERFNLDQISERHQLYGAVIDLNEHSELKSLFPNIKPEVLNISVILALEFNIDVRWKLKTKMIHLALYSDFYQQGDVNELSEIKRF